MLKADAVPRNFRKYDDAFPLVTHVENNVSRWPIWKPDSNSNKALLGNEH
jgi:hypothetical protein